MTTNEAKTAAENVEGRPWNRDQVAEYLGVHRVTVRRWIREGRLPQPGKIGSREYWDPGIVKAAAMGRAFSAAG